MIRKNLFRAKSRKRIPPPLRCPGCVAKARLLKREEIIKVGPARYWFRWAKCPRCTKTFLIKESSRRLSTSRK